MKVTVAKSAGFCFGVKRAVEQVYQQLETGKKPVYTYGPIIHNDQVVKELEQKGVRVIRSEEELERLGEGTVIIRSHGVSRRVLCFVSQTTFNYNKFEELVEILLKKRYDSHVINTVCNATEERQSEAEGIAAKVDVMLVIGGRHSSNTQKLFEICSNKCKNTYFVETLDDLDTKPFQSFRHVGITAGASTPKKIIEEVQKHVGIKF